MRITQSEKIWDSFGEELCNIMKSSTVSDFIHYLKDNANEIVHTNISVDGELQDVTLYCIEDAFRFISDIFIVTSNGRLYCQKLAFGLVELVNNSDLYYKEFNILRADVSFELYKNSMQAFLIQYGRLIAFLQLSDLTDVERDNEEERLHEIYSEWERTYTGGKNK